jgi:hypothetical protein
VLACDRVPELSRQAERLDFSEHTFCIPIRNQAQANATSGPSQTDPREPSRGADCNHGHLNYRLAWHSCGDHVLPPGGRYPAPRLFREETDA